MKIQGRLAKSWRQTKKDGRENAYASVKARTVLSRVTSRAIDVS